MADVTVRTLKIKLDADGTLVVSGVESAKRKLGELGRESQTLSQRMQGHWQAFKQQWVGITAGITAAILAMRKAWDLMDMAAKFQEQKEAVGALAAQYQISADQMLEAIQAQARGLVSLADSANIAARALNLGFAPDQILQMVMVAERFSDVLGNDLVQATVDLAQAIGTQQTRMLKQLGVVVDAEDAYRKYADQIGKTADELSAAEKRAAFFDEAMAQMLVRVGMLGEASDSNADKFQRVAVAWEDAKLAIGGFLIDVALSIAAGMDAVIGYVSSAVAVVLKGLAMAQEFLGKFGITFGTDFTAMWAKVDDFSKDQLEMMKKNWELAWGETPKAPKKALEEVKRQIEVAALPESMKPQSGPDTRAHFFGVDMAAGLQADVDASLAILTAFYAASRAKAKTAGNDEVAIRELTEAEKREIISNSLGTMAGMFQTLANIQGEHQAAAFALFKAFAIAQAVIDTHGAYMIALRTLPPPFSYIAAAAAVAAGVARVAAIASTQPNTGTTAVASSIGPGTAGVSQPANQATGGSSGPTIINFHFSGARVVDRRAMDEFAREFAPSLARARRDGARF